MHDGFPSTAPLPPIPFLVGISGHRALLPAAVPALRAALRRELTAVHGTGAPVTVLSALADGADRLAAEVAWELGLAVVAVLPMPQDDYRQDFDAASDAWFLAALPRCQRVVALPWVAERRERNEQYVALAAYLMAHSQVLVALWDGAEGLAASTPCLPGGTADVVRRHLSGDLPVHGAPERMLDLESQGVVLHLVAPRHDRPAPAQPAGTAAWLSTGHDGTAARLRVEQARQRLALLNRDLAVERAAALTTTGDAEVDTQLNGLRRRLAACDAMAARLQLTVMGQVPRSDRANWRAQLRHGGLAQWIACLALVGVLLQEGSGIWLPSAWWVAPLCGLLGAVAYALVLMTWRLDLHGRYLDYRALAEGLRVQLWWRVAGVDEVVSDHYFHRQRGSADWLRLVLRALAQELPPGRTVVPDHARILVQTGWLVDQQTYFVQAAARARWNLKRLRRWGVSLLGISLLLMVAKAVIGTWAGPALPAVIAAVQFTAAILLGYSGVQSLAEHANAYQRMGDIFARAITWCGTGADLAAVARETGREALAENAAWLQVHRQRPVEFGRSGLMVKVLGAVGRLRAGRR